MNKRSFVYLAIAVAVAAVVFLIERPGRFVRGVINEGPLVLGYDADKITRIEVSQLLSGVQIEKSDGAWRVADLPTEMRKQVLDMDEKPPSETVWYPADIAVIGSALGVFGDLARGVVVSSNPERHELYHAAGPLGLHVRLYEGSHPVVDVVIGKTSSDFTGNYVRRADADEVMIADRKIEHLFPTAVPEWRDRTIWRVDPRQIASIAVARPKHAYELRRGEDGAWQLVHGSFAIAQDKVDAVAARLAHLVASGFASVEDPRANFKNASIEIALGLTGGGRLELKAAGANNLQQLYARREGDDQIYLVSGLDAAIPTEPTDFKK